MRKIKILTVLSFLAISVSAQLHISTNLRIDYSWNEEEDTWKAESQDEEALTFFEFNKDFSLLKHTTPTVTTAYVIQSQMVDEEDGRNQHIFVIMSDIGNKYILIYDIENDNIRIVAADTKSMIKHKVKSAWVDE